MDTLPVLLTAVSKTVRSIRILRVVDAGTRREALQRKVGAGLTRDEFAQLAESGRIRHVGLCESLAFIAEAIGKPWDGITETLEPVLRADGRVAGVKQVATSAPLRLELQMYVGAAHPRDEIHIDGEPALEVVIQGGTPGDIATPAILVNMLPRLLEARPGLHTMRTLPLPHIAP
jgi:4-hydroxy-tetrahydrodipicolinate reductase